MGTCKQSPCIFPLYKPKLDINVLITSLGPIDIHSSGKRDLTLRKRLLSKLATQTLSYDSV